MKSERLSELNEHELNQRSKRIKNSKIIDALLIGFTVGIAVFSAASSGFGFTTLFPLILVYMFIRNSSNNKILEKEIKKELELRRPK